ncbi:membrane protein, partial [Elysia marginata]
MIFGGKKRPTIHRKSLREHKRRQSFINALTGSIVLLKQRAVNSAASDNAYQTDYDSPGAGQHDSRGVFMDVLILIALILLNGVFAMSEIALVSSRKSRLQKLADKGDAGAASAIRLGEEPTRFLSTVQIGITVIGLLNGIYGEAALAAPLAEYLVTFDISSKTASAASTVIVVIAITYLSIVVGELVPKRLAQLNPELFARLMARPLSLLALLSKPFVSLLAWSTDLLLRLLGKRGGESEENIIEEDIIALMAEGSRSGVIEAQERDMVRNVFHLDDRNVSSLMTPR